MKFPTASPPKTSLRKQDHATLVTKNVRYVRVPRPGAKTYRVKPEVD